MKGFFGPRREIEALVEREREQRAESRDALARLNEEFRDRAHYFKNRERIDAEIRFHSERLKEIGWHDPDPKDSQRAIFEAGGACPPDGHAIIERWRPNGDGD